jgi:hypothetical protein
MNISAFLSLSILLRFRGGTGNSYRDTLQVHPCKLGASIPAGYSLCSYYPSPCFDYVRSLS